MQIPRYAKTVLALMISAAFSACALQTERSSSGPGASGRTTAPPVPPKAAEYEPAQYASPPDYESAQYAEPPAEAVAEEEAVEEGDADARHAKDAKLGWNDGTMDRRNDAFECVRSVVPSFHRSIVPSFRRSIVPSFPRPATPPSSDSTPIPAGPTGRGLETASSGNRRLRAGRRGLRCPRRPWP